MTPLVWKLTVDSSEALAQVKAFSVEASKAPPIALKVDVSAVVSAQERVAKSAEKAAAAQYKATAQLNSIAASTDKAAIAASKYEKEQIRIAELSAISGDQVAINAAIAASEEKLALAKAKVSAETKAQSLLYRDISSPMSDMISGMSGIAIAAATAVAAVTGLGVAFNSVLSGVLNAGAQMEIYSNRLITMMHSTSAAKERMKELFDFAVKTPFNIEQVVSAEVAMRGFGAETKKLMPGLIDFAATTGQDLSQAAVDIGRAWSFGATGLRSDSAKMIKGMIELRTGIKPATMDIETFRKSLLSVLNEGDFAGGAERLSKTYTGMISNLEDEWFRFKMEVADAGIFNNVKGALAETLDIISDNKKEIAATAKVTSTLLWDAIKGVTFAAAYMVDTFASLGTPIVNAEQNMREFGAASLEVFATVADGALSVDEALGVATKKEKDNVVALHQWAIAARQSALENKAVIASAYGISATNAVEKFFQNAEARAGEFGTVLEDLVNQPPNDNKGGGSGKGKKQKETLIKDSTIEDELKAAKKFQESLTDIAMSGERERQAPIKQTTKEVWEEMQERLRIENQYQSDGVYNEKEGAEARAQIYHEYSRKIRAIAEQDAEERKKIADKNQQWFYDKGKSDIEEMKKIAKENAAALADAAQSFVGSLKAIASMAAQSTYDAASAASGEVSHLKDLLKGLSTDTVDAAKLSGKALVKAYESGSVAAEDLTEAQRIELERNLKTKEKAAEKEAKIQKEAAMQSWEISQAVSYAQAIMQGSLAIVNALATMSYPAAPIVAAAAGVAAGVEIASIASAEPPSFRGGGIVSDSIMPAANFLPDVRMIAAEAGESINTRRGTETLGGEEGVRRINAGIPPAPVEVHLRLGHQTLEKVIADGTKRPGTLRSLTRNPTRRNPYIGR